MFDNCDIIGNWVVSGSENELVTDTTDKVEGTGSHRMTWSKTGADYGGMFYRDVADGENWSVPESLWDFSVKPMLKLYMKEVDTIPAWMQLTIITGDEDDIYSWRTYTYNIVPQITPQGSWVLVEVDLRLPDTYPATHPWPYLLTTKQFAFTAWDILIPDPVEFKADQIEAFVGVALPLECYLTPAIGSTIVGNALTFTMHVREGVPPYTYEWRVDDVVQPEETASTFEFTPLVADTYTIKCTVTDDDSTTVSDTATAIAMDPVDPTPDSPEALKSEVRGAFLHLWWGAPDLDLDLAAQTCLDYGINMVVVESYTTHFWETGTGVIDWPLLRTAITAFHAKGIRVHLLLTVGLTPFAGMETLTSSGTINWLDFTKVASKQMLQDIAVAIGEDYDLDGFMFDYIRWDFNGTDMPLGDEARAAFIAETGHGDVDWPTDILGEGIYYWDFIQWRILPITDAVRDMRSTMLSYNPDLEISAAVFPCFEACGNYQVVYLGQHTADWIGKGYLDFVAPMLYSATVATNTANLIDSLDFFTGGAEGKIPMLAFVTLYADTTTVADFVSNIEAMLSNGADGWIIWCYGGPGNWLGTLTDMRPYIAALKEAGDILEPTWVVKNVEAQAQSSNNALITWETSEATKGSVEYKDTPLFVATEKYNDFGRPLYYKDIDYVGGATSEDETPKTEHSFTIPVTDETEFRIQSTDIDGVIVTSGVMSDLDENGDPKMEQEKYDSLKARITSIRKMRAQWPDEAVISALMTMIDEILDTLAP